MTKTAFITGVLTLLLLVSPSKADIKTLTLTSDTRPTILLEKFGFTHTGHVAVTASSVSVAGPSQPNPSQLGFFILSEESLPQVITEIEQNPTFCTLNSAYIIRLFTFSNLSPPPATFNRTYPVTSPSEYCLFFANCATESSVTITVRTELYNLDSDGSRNYLSASQTHLPSLFFLFSVAYFAFLCHVSKRHLLMASLLLVKALNLLCAAVDKQYVKHTGTSHGWDVVFFVLDFILVVLLFTVVVSVGTRWTFLPPVVRERGKKVLFVVIPLQGLANVALIVIRKTGPYIKDWITFNQVFLLLDFCSCCAVVFLFVWSIRSFRKGNDAMNLDKFSVIRRFYMVVVGYIFVTRFVLFAVTTVVAYEYLWVSNLVEETASLVFCIVMFYVFRLVQKDQYSVIGEEEEDVDQNEIAAKK